MSRLSLRYRSRDDVSRTTYDIKFSLDTPKLYTCVGLWFGRTGGFINATLFQTSHLDIISDCSYLCGVVMPSKLVELRSTGFLVRYSNAIDALCNLLI